MSNPTVEIYSQANFNGEKLSLAIGRYNRKYLTEHSQELKTTLTSIRIPKQIVVNITARKPSGESISRALFSGSYPNILDDGFTELIDSIDVISFRRSTGSDEGQVHINYKTGKKILGDGDHAIENPESIRSVTIKPATLAVFYDGVSYRKADRSFAVKGPIIMTDDMHYPNVYIIPLQISGEKEKKVSINAEKIDVEEAKEIREHYKTKSNNPAICICVIVFLLILVILIAIKIYKSKTSPVINNPEAQSDITPVDIASINVD